MMRADALNLHVYPVRTEMTAPSSHVFSTDKEKSKLIIVHETLLQSCSMNEGESKRNIVNETLLQDCPWTRKNEVLRRKTNYNALLQNKKTQRMRLHMMCQTILTSLTYLNVEESF